VVCLGLAGVGFFVVSGYVPPPHASLSAQELADFYASHHDRIRIGMLITLVAWLGWATLVAVITAQMSRIETGTKVLTILQAICGTLGWVILNNRLHGAGGSRLPPEAGPGDHPGAARRRLDHRVHARGDLHRPGQCVLPR